MVCIPPCVCGSVNIGNGTRALVFLDEPSSGQQGGGVSDVVSTALYVWKCASIGTLAFFHLFLGEWKGG